MKTKPQNPLKPFIKRLVAIDPDKSPLISCFVNLEQPRANYFADLEPVADFYGRRLSGKRRDDYEDALAEVRDCLAGRLDPASKSMAIYSRWGEKPVFAAKEFRVGMSTEFIVDTLPHIYPLIQLKDTYKRFVIVVSTETDARIMETTIGSVTEEILAKRPDLRKRVGREWTRRHYQNHKREKENQFIREKVELIDRLMSSKGTNYLVLAGNPKMTSRLRRALPLRLRNRVLDTVSAASVHNIDPVLMDSMNLIAGAEDIESHDRVDLLERSLMTDGLGVVGYEAVRHALVNGSADVLVIDQEFEDPESREELVRLATKGGVEVETVRRSEKLKHLSGVGCLLRFRNEPTSFNLPLEAAVS